MMNAIVVGLVFVALLRVLGNPPGALLLGAAYGAGLWALQRYFFLPINTPEDRLFMTGMISPQWVWWVAHIALGTTFGLVYLAVRPLAARCTRASPPAGRARGARPQSGVNTAMSRPGHQSGAPFGQSSAPPPRGKRRNSRSPPWRFDTRQSALHKDDHPQR